MARLRTAGVLAALALVACTPTAPTQLPTAGATEPPATTTAAGTLAPSPSPDRLAGWRSDLDMLVPSMARIHPDLTHGVSRAALDTAVADLVAGISTSSDDELMTGVLHVVAMVSSHGCDAHTGAFVWGTGTYPVDSLPLRLWLFRNSDGVDDVVIVDALPAYEGLIGATIDAVDGVPLSDALRRLDPLIPRDNAQTVRLLTPRFLLIPQILRGIGVGDGGDVTLTLKDIADPQDVTPVPMADYNAWAGPYGLHLPADPDVLYLSRIADALWWQRLQDGDTLFVQYNRMDRLAQSRFNELRAELHKSDVARVVLDLRHNFGGEVSEVDRMMGLFEDPAVDQPDRLFVLTGRNTFSAASLLVARLDHDTGATIVGEAMGGCPTSYGNPEEFTLPFSGIVVSVAAMLEVGIATDDARATIEPDIATQLTFDEWADGSDPALGMISTLVP